MSSQLKLLNSHSNAPFEKENGYHNNHFGNITESPQDQTTAEPEKNPTEKTYQNTLQILEPSYSENFTGLVQNSSAALQPQGRTRMIPSTSKKLPPQQIP